MTESSQEFSGNTNKGLKYHMRRRLAAVLVGMIAMLCGCADDELILKGERISILPSRTVVAGDPEALDEGAGLPLLVNMMAAPVIGLDSGHAGGHVQFEGTLSRVWSTSIGGKGSALVDLATPVVAENRVYVVAPNGLVTAFDLETGAVIWSNSVEELADDPLPGVGGGIVVSPKGLVVHAGGRNLALLDAGDGSIVWSIASELPLRGGPTMIEDQAVVVTDLDGNLHVYRLETGEAIWERAGLASETVIFGAPAPAYANGGLVVAGARGEVTYFNADDGELLWTDSVATLSPRTSIEGIGNIRAHPIHDGGLIFVVSQSGRLAAFSGRNGLLVWEQRIGGIEMPWLAGKTLFVMGHDGRLYALRRSDGVVRWVTALPDASPPDAIVAENPPRYVGPVVAGNKVVVISKSGRVHMFDPDNGLEIGTKSLGMTVLTPPQIVAGKMFVLDINGTLSAFE